MHSSESKRSGIRGARDLVVVSLSFFVVQQHGMMLFILHRFDFNWGVFRVCQVNVVDNMYNQSHEIKLLQCVVFFLQKVGFQFNDYLPASSYNNHSAFGFDEEYFE